MSSKQFKDLHKFIYGYIYIYIKTHGISPNLREIRHDMAREGISGQVGPALRMLEKKGLISLQPGEKRGIQLIPQYMHIPVMGSIAAGQPLEIFSEPGYWLDVVPGVEDIRLGAEDVEFSMENAYASVVRGNSMIEDGIHDGDYVLIKPQYDYEYHDIVVASHLLPGGFAETTLKHFFRDPYFNRVRLQPANSALEPYFISGQEWDREWVVQGKAVALIQQRSSLNQGELQEEKEQFNLDFIRVYERFNEETHQRVDAVTRKEAELHQPQPRHLHARLPERVRIGDRIPLQVRVALTPALRLDRSASLRAFPIPPQGVDVKIVLDCPGFLLHSTSISTVHVVPTADSDWVLFELEALHDGVQTLEVSAFNGGAFLGTLFLQLAVDSLAVRGQSIDHVALLPLRPPEEGEVTLVIHYDSSRAMYRYQFRGTTFGESDELQSGPLQRKQEDAIADFVALLNEQARDLTGYSAQETRRWLRGKGTELWNELIPKELERLFWQ